MIALTTHGWDWAAGHFQERLAVSQRLKAYLAEEEVRRYAELAVGETDAAGNYSANEHALGARILASENGHKRVYELGKRLGLAVSTAEVPKLIAEAQIEFLKISVGSEMACMLQPQAFWVGNKKTVWAYLVESSGGSVHNANIARYQHTKMLVSSLSTQKCLPAC